MRNTNLIIISLLGIVFFLVLGLSCSTSKTKAAINHSITITLKEKLSGKYLTENYTSFNPKEITKANRTLNQYRAIFLCSNKDFDLLDEKLRKDSNIIEVRNSKSNNNKPQSDKNDKFGQTKPIRDKN